MIFLFAIVFIIVRGFKNLINDEYARAAFEAGAKFIVSPCTKESVIRYTKEMGMISIPGAYTPTEIVNAYDLGADIVKVFPVASGEVGYLKNVMSPLSHIPFIPTGGINPDTIKEFMATGAIAVAAGATVVTKDLVEKGDFDFNVRYTIVGFDIMVSQGSEVKVSTHVNGAKFTPDVLAQINKLRRGGKVFIDNITAKGPAGEVQVANSSIIFTIK